MAETIETVSLRAETEERYLTYAMSVIMARALPDVRDGLKPVQRRILYTMYHDLHLTFDGRPRKCAKIVGDVTGNYHPHGTVPAYEALVRLAQDWVMRIPLVHGQGNFGSVDGDPPAAERYTEAKLAAASESLMAELGQRTVNVRPNYDNTREEPVVLPAQFPNLLVNGAAGIAVGLATNIPPHNLGEVLRACVHLIENPEATTAQLMDKVKGPDFPLGGKIVTDRAALRQIYENGQGTVKVQGEWKVEEGKRPQIVITSIPYGVDKGKLESDIGEIIASRKLPQLLNLTNESNEKEGLRIALEVKPGSDANVVMAYLYKHTQLQDTFPCNFTCLVPVADEEGNERVAPRRLGLREVLRHFLDFRFATVRRRFEYELEQLRRRIHILEGFRAIFNALDRALKIIRDSEGKADASAKLQRAFRLDETQASAVLDAQLYKIAQLEIQKILDELKDKTERAETIQKILGSNKKLWGVVKDELGALADKHAKDRRRTRLGSAEDAPEFDPEAYIVRENTNVVLTRDGWIKRVGRLASVEGTRVREGDAVMAVMPGSTLDHVVFFTDDGTAYTMRINEVPASSGYGEPIAKYFRLADQVKPEGGAVPGEARRGPPRPRSTIVAAVSTDERFTPVDQPPANGEPAGPYVLAVTAGGQALRTPLAPYRTASTKVGRRYARLVEGDRVVMVAVLRDEDSLFLASASGHVIHFRLDEINILAGAGKGVLGIKLREGDACLGGALISNRHDALVVETAGGKTMEFRRGKYEVTSRGGKGFEAVKRTTFVRVVPPPIELVDWDKVEEREPHPNGNGHNGQQKTLFD
jgi:DNA gyrase subunit A